MIDNKVIFYLETGISGQDLVRHIVNNCEYEEIINLIESIDEELCDWAFTEMLIDIGKKFEQEEDESENKE